MLQGRLKYPILSRLDGADTRVVKDTNLLFKAQTHIGTSEITKLLAVSRYSIYRYQQIHRTSPY